MSLQSTILKAQEALAAGNDTASVFSDTTHASSSRIKISNDITQGMSQTEDLPVIQTKIVKKTIKDVLHRLASLIKTNPERFSSTTVEDNDAISFLAKWAAEQTHLTVKQLQEKITKYTTEAQQKVDKGNIRGPLEENSPEKFVFSKAFKTSIEKFPTITTWKERTK